MRNYCVKKIKEKLNNNQENNAYFLTGDLGFSVLEPLIEIMGKNFLNCGIAESNMMSVAAGIAFEGRKVFTYSIIPFTTFRCLEQIRNDICYHNVDVTIIGIGAGYGYGHLGPTHHAIDDLGVMMAIPELTVYCPNDERELELIFNEVWDSKKPKYLRLGKGGEGRSVFPNVQFNDGAFLYGDKGAELTVVLCGTMLSDFASILSSEEDLFKKINVISIARAKPFPEFEKFKTFIAPKIVIIQELSEYSGIIGQVYFQLSKLGLSSNVKYVYSAPDAFAKKVGSQDFQRKKAGLGVQSIINNLKLLI